MTSGMKRLDHQEESIIINKGKYESMQQRLVATQNLTLILQEKESEITRLNQKLKSLEQNLLTTHKLLGQRTLQIHKKNVVGSMDQDSGLGTCRGRDVILDRSLSSPSYMTSLTEDGDVGTVPIQEGFIPRYSTERKKASKDGFGQEESVKVQCDQGASLQTKNSSILNNDKQVPEEKMSVTSQRSNAHVQNVNIGPLIGSDYGVFSYQQTSYRKLQSLADIWSLNPAVSKQNFYAVVKELKKTKASLKEALSRNDSDLAEVVKTTNYRDRINSQEAQIKTLTEQVDRLMDEREILHKQIEQFQRFKHSLREEREGVSVPPPAMPPEVTRGSSLDEERRGELRSSSTGSSAGTVVSNPKSLCSPVADNVHDFSSEARIREKKLQDELNYLKADFNSMKMERDDFKMNYEALLRSIQDVENRLDESKLVKEKEALIEENISMRREIKNLQEDNTEFLNTRTFLYNQISAEKHATLRAQAELENERQNHQYTKFEQHKQFLYLNEKIENLRRENAQLQDRLRHISYSGNQQTMNHEEIDISSYGRTYKEQIYTCEHCLQDFTDEKEHLEHITKCMP